MAEIKSCPRGYELFQGACHKKMIKPRYSSIDWYRPPSYSKPLPHDKIIVDREHVMAKGSDARMRSIQSAAYNIDDYLLKETVKIKIKPGIADTEKIGGSLYSTEHLYRIAEEITGKQILKGHYKKHRAKLDLDKMTNRQVDAWDKAWKTMRTPLKSMVGKTITLKTRQKQHGQPIIIEGNNGYYLLAPRVEQ